MIEVTWCSFCSSAPASGLLTIEFDDGTMDELPCCDECVAQHALDNKINGYN